MSIKRKTQKPESRPIPTGQVASGENNNRVQVTHDNASLLTVKFMELILIELRKITEKLEKE